VRLIVAAEASGELKPGSHIVEPTSGETGFAPAFVAAAKGYPSTLVMPESMSLERRTLPWPLRGAELVLAPSRRRESGGERSRRRRNSWPPIPMLGCRQQFNRPCQPRRCRGRTTAEEVWADTDGEIDLFIAAAGTGGTITGVTEVIKSTQSPSCNRSQWSLPASVRSSAQTLKGEPGGAGTSTDSEAPVRGSVPRKSLHGHR